MRRQQPGCAHCAFRRAGCACPGAIFLLTLGPLLLVVAVGDLARSEIREPGPTRYDRHHQRRSRQRVRPHRRALSRDPGAAMASSCRSCRPTARWKICSGCATRSSKSTSASCRAGWRPRKTAKRLVSLGSIYHEPLWVFSRCTAPVHELSQLTGKRLAIGPEGSGTRVLVSELLKANGMNLDVAQCCRWAAKTRRRRCEPAKPMRHS